MHTQGVGRQRLRQALLEGLLLQLQEDAVRLLPLGLAFLGGLSPAPGTSCYPMRAPTRLRSLRGLPGRGGRPAPFWAPSTHWRLYLGKTWETSLSPPTPSMDVGMARSNGEVCEAPNSWHSRTRSTQRTTTTPG